MILEYKNLQAHVKYSPITRTYYGEVMFKDELIVFQTSQREDIRRAMREAIDQFSRSEFAVEP